MLPDVQFIQANNYVRVAVVINRCPVECDCKVSIARKDVK